jgi:NADP-dependent 3-hydroxy acid dehydrogenase YdfG
MNGRVAAVARRFAGVDFMVVMMARRKESLAQIRQDIENDGDLL